MDIGFFRLGDGGSEKRCGDCAELGHEIALEATKAWSPRFAAYVDIWECPRCDRQVMREEDGEVRLTTPEGERF